MSKPKPISADEPALWAEHLQVLKVGISRGDRDTDAQIKTHIQRLNDELFAMQNRREFVLRADLKQGNLKPQAAKMTEEIASIAAKVDDLRKLLHAAKRIPADKVDGPTPEMAAKPARVDPIEWLERYEVEHPRQGLTHDQARAAKEIASVSEAISRAGQAKVGNMQGTGGGAGGGGYREPDMPPKMEEARCMRFIPWADYLNDTNPITLDICMKVSVLGVSLNALARKHKMRRERVLERLQEGLGRYWDERTLLPMYLDKVAARKAAWDQRATAS